MISEFGRKTDSDSVSRVKLGHLLLQMCPPPPSYFVFTPEVLAGISLPVPGEGGGGLHRPEWSQFLPAITVREIKGAADKGICRPSGCVRGGGVTFHREDDVEVAALCHF